MSHSCTQAQSSRTTGRGNLNCHWRQSLEVAQCLHWEWCIYPYMLQGKVCSQKCRQTPLNLSSLHFLPLCHVLGTWCLFLVFQQVDSRVHLYSVFVFLFQKQFSNNKLEIYERTNGFSITCYQMSNYIRSCLLTLYSEHTTGRLQIYALVCVLMVYTVR